MKNNIFDQIGNYYNNFAKQHPVLTNFTLACIVVFATIYAVFLCLDIFTHHGAEAVVPDVRYKQTEAAITILKDAGLDYEIDSIYNEDYRPGIVIEQDPSPNATVKEGRSIYLIVNMTNPPKIAIPNELEDMPGADGYTLLKSLGFKNVVTDTIPSDKMGLIIDIKVNGRRVTAGTQVPVNARVQLMVGDGQLDTEEYDPLGEMRDSLIQEQIKRGQIKVVRDSNNNTMLVN